jgi:hypothetical protein
MPSRTQTRKDIAALAVELRVNLKAMIKEGCLYFAVMTDIWTSRGAESYVSLTLHYLDAQFRMCNWAQEVTHFPGRHSRAAIAEGLNDLLKQWGLNPAFYMKLVRDGAANAVLAGEIFGILHSALTSPRIRWSTSQAQDQEEGFCSNCPD